MSKTDQKYKLWVYAPCFCKNLNLSKILKTLFFCILILHLGKLFVKSDNFLFFGGDGAEGEGRAKTPHDAESLRKTFKIFNLTTKNATMRKLTMVRGYKQNTFYNQPEPDFWLSFKEVFR